MDRREFGRMAALAGVGAGRAWAAGSGLPPGIQLYAVREPLAADYAGTLKALAAMGYREVETFTFGTYEPAQVRKMIADTGLRVPSAHLEFTMDNELGPVFAQANALGVEYAVSSFLRKLDDPGRKSLGNGAAKQNSMPPMGLEGFQQMAARMNAIGRGAKGAGLTYAYHNHNFEFEKMPDGGTGYDVLLRETDAATVKFEVDCGWMVAAGGNPVDYFKRYPNRFKMLHVKDFKRAAPTTDMVGAGRPQGTELGTGYIDYRPIFAAAKSAGIEHAFAEQEAPYTRPQLESARLSLNYLKSLG